MAATLGLHLSALAPEWDVARVEPQMEMLKEAGIRLLDIPLARPAGFDAARARGFAQRWNVGLSLSVRPPPALDPLENPQDALDFLETALRACAEAGAPGLGGLPGPGFPHAPSQKAVDGLSRFAERAARLARAHGVKVGLRPGTRFETPLLTRAAQAAWIVERVGAESLFIGLDSFAMRIEEEDFSAACEAAAPFLGHMTLSESNRGLPGRGLADWTAQFKALDAIGYAGPLALRVDPPADAALPAPWRRADTRPEALAEEGLPFVREKAREAGFALG